MKGIGAYVLVLFMILAIPFSAIGQVQVIETELDYSDPASDVTWIYENGTQVMMSEPKDVNIKWLRSELESMGTMLKLTIELSSPGQIRTDNVTVYTVNVYTTPTNESHYVVNYTNGQCTLGTNTSSAIVNGSLQYTIGDGEISIQVNISELMPIDYFNIDASAQTLEYEGPTTGWVVKKDFGWEVSGNPGTTPEDPPDDTGTPGFGLLTIAAAAVIACGVIAISKRKGH